MSTDSLGFTDEEIKEKAELLGIQIEENSAESAPAIQEGQYNTSEVIEAARTSPDFLAAMAMPLIFKYFFPPVYLQIWNWLLENIHKTRDFSQLALGLPRGFAKTTLIKLFVLYTILFTDRKFICICCENAKKAINIVADICDMLEEPNIKAAFGDWKLGLEIDRQDLKKFGFRGRNIIILAGTVEVIRGITIKNERPDLMIFDDIQSRDCSESPVQSDALERELYGTAMKAKSPHGCLFIFIANMYPTKYSLLRKIKSNPQWVKFIAGGILADGTSLWEDLQPISQLLKEFENDLASGHPEIFYAEVLNDENASVNRLVDLSKLPVYPFTENEIAVGNYIIIDPSNDKSNSDAVSIGYFEVLDSYPVAKIIIEDRLSPGDTIRKALQLALENNCRLIVVEANAFQYSLLYWFNFICQQLGIIGIECVDIYSGSLSKNTRILNMFKSLQAGEIFIHENCKTAVYHQISQFNPLKRDNTDGILDLLTYAPRVLEMYAEFIQINTYLMDSEFSAIQEYSTLENSSF